MIGLKQQQIAFYKVQNSTVKPIAPGLSEYQAYLMSKTTR